MPVGGSVFMPILPNQTGGTGSFANTGIPILRPPGAVGNFPPGAEGGEEGGRSGGRLIPERKKFTEYEKEVDVRLGWPWTGSYLPSLRPSLLSPQVSYVREGCLLPP
jgi:hypothetical protein